MTAGTMTPYRPGQVTGRDGFAQLLRSEWTKFRTVRGWVIGMAVAVLVTLGLGLFAAGATSSSCQHDGGPVRTGSACGGTFAVGPGGEPVDDSFYFVRQPPAGNGSITVRVTSLTGLLPPPNGNPPSNPAAPLAPQPRLPPPPTPPATIKTATTPA